MMVVGGLGMTGSEGETIWMALDVEKLCAKL